MPWNQDGGRPEGPWGQGARPPQPPDMEKVIRMARERFGGKGGGSRSGWAIFLAIAFLLWMATGVYVVAPDELGVVLRFGKMVRTAPPGPHLAFPSPIEEVYKPKITQVRRVEVGYRTQARDIRDVPEESLMLTGDENIIDIDLSVQYRIKDADHFLFKVRNPSFDQHFTVRGAAEAAVRHVIGKNSIDEALTTGKEGIQANTKTQLQKILDAYESGIEIVAVQLQQVQPPEAVIHAFKDVASAREDKERSVNEAEGYANDILPKAHGQAARLVQEAEGYKLAKVARAEGDVNRFLALLAEYEKAKDITRTRLYLETMEEVFSNVEKVIIDPGVGSGVLPYLPLDRRGRVVNPTEVGR